MPHNTLHPNDRKQLDTWYNDLTKRLITTNKPSNSRYVAGLLKLLLTIGDALDRRK